MKTPLCYLFLLFAAILGCNQDQSGVLPESTGEQAIQTVGKKTAEQAPKRVEREKMNRADSYTCAECHKKEYDLWKTSFHARTMNHATNETVLGDFQNVQIFVIGFNDLLRLTDQELDIFLQSNELLSSDWKTDFWVDLAIALQDEQPGIKTTDIKNRLLHRMNQAIKNGLQLQLDHRNKIGFTRPVEIAVAQNRILDRIQMLSQKGFIKLNFGIPFRMFHQDDHFYVATENQRGIIESFPIAYVLGIKSLQQYLVEFPDGRIQCLPVAWSINGKKWLYLYPQERILPDDPLHWTRTLQNWNGMCAACHTTDFRKNFDLKENRFDSSWSDLNVGCLTCHVDRIVETDLTTNTLEYVTQNSNTNTDTNITDNNSSNTIASNNNNSSDNNDDLKTCPSHYIRNETVSKTRSCQKRLPQTPKKFSAVLGAETKRPTNVLDNPLDENTVSATGEKSSAPDFGFLACLDCHSRRRVLLEGSLFPEEDFLDRFNPELPDRDCYYSDGQIRDENFEYGSFLQSRMYFMQVKCNDCHNPHSLALKFEGNRLCAQCHSPDLYDTPRHHFHDPTLIPSVATTTQEVGSPDRDETQSQVERHLYTPLLCIDCHAPSATYMLVDKRHDHFFKKPQPELTIELGVPNACNLCHFNAQKGEDANWAKTWIDKWYSEKRKSSVGYSQTNVSDPHFAFAIAKGRNGAPTGIDPLISVAQETRGREIRPITRASAVSLLGQYNTKEAKEVIIAALSDTNALLRLAAVSSAESFSQEEQLQCLLPLLCDPIRAIRIETARVTSSIPKSKFSEADRTNWIQAAREYIDSLKLIEDSPQSHLNLGVFRYNIVLEQLPRPLTLEMFRNATEPVVQHYLNSLRIEPSFIPSRINLGMLYNEREEPEKAEQEFRNVLKHDPNMGEVYYSLALLLAEQSRFEESLEPFQKAIALLPDRSRIRYNYGLALMKLGKWESAKATLEQVLATDPDSSDTNRALLIIKEQQKNQNPNLRGQ
ncbi:MAG: tetratricopeptide repeat protein [Thermoguttaceae bacterium]